MRTFWLLSICIFWNIQATYCQMQAEYEAKINMGGVKGSVKFLRGLAPGVTIVTFSLQGLQNNNRWEIRQNRRMDHAWMRCLDRDIGQKFIDFEGVVKPGANRQVFSLRIPNQQLMSRAVFLIDEVTGDRVCGTLESSDTHWTATAQFTSNVAGKIVFRQIVNKPGSPTSMLVDLFKTRELNPVAEDVRWMVVGGRGMTAAYNTMAPLLCQNTFRLPMRKVHVWNLLGKHGLLPIGSKRHEGKRTYVDTYLPLNGVDSVIGKVVLLTRNNSEIVSCALIRKVKERKAFVPVFYEKVRGTIHFSQLSEYDPTKVVMNLKNLESLAGGYHIHKWPVPERQETGNICADSFIGGHYNPYNIDPKSSPPPGTGTDNQYEVGDLSGKYGLLTGLDVISKTFYDDNLPLIGKYSIIGRSFTIHKSADGSRWICANVLQSVPVIRAVATFTNPVIGRVVFTQEKHEAFADTQVFVELNYADGTIDPTSNHTWRVHTKRICSNFEQNTCDCSNAGDIYNPYKVETKGAYDRECRFCNPLRCQVGDIGDKHWKKLSIKSRKGANGFQKKFVTDEILPLTGPLSIIGKSLVIYASNSDTVRLACANIYELPLRIVKVNKFHTMSPSHVAGTFTFTGDIPQYESKTSMIGFYLNNLNKTAKGYHVHKYPVQSSSETPCSPDAVGGHFNPFDINIKTSPPAGTGTHDMYEIGDLSGKYGNILVGKESVYAQGFDNFLPVRGPLSITGRSVVIHKPDGSRWVCGNIVEDVSKTGGRLVRGRATFTGGQIQGIIELSQYVYKDGTLSDTGILMDLFYTDSMKKSAAHNWHVHVDPVQGDAYTGCISAGPHYNPFNVNVKVGYDECSPKNPLRCELGDTSGKHGPCDIGGGRRFFTDVNLPLIGRFGVIGRSIVIHKAHQGTARVLCTNIEPVDSSTKQ